MNDPGLLLERRKEILREFENVKRRLEKINRTIERLGVKDDEDSTIR